MATPNSKSSRNIVLIALAIVFVVVLCTCGIITVFLLRSNQPVTFDSLKQSSFASSSKVDQATDTRVKEITNEYIGDKFHFEEIVVTKRVQDGVNILEVSVDSGRDTDCYYDIEILNDGLRTKLANESSIISEFDALSTRHFCIGTSSIWKHFE
jgi:hypothetical protein